MSIDRGALPAMRFRGRGSRRVHMKAMAKEFDVLPIVREVIDIEAWYAAETAAKNRDELLTRVLRLRGVK